jgi:hypothetical protein
VAAIDGVATFADVSIAMVGSGYQLQAASGTVTSPLSVAFDITPAPASHLTFTAQPSSTAAGAAVSPAVQVMAWDQFGNMGTNFADDVTVRITSGTGAAGAALSGTTTVAAVSGVASFNDLSIDLIGTGYTLTAEARGVTSGTSAAFNITPAPATQLTFSVQPSTTAAGCPITPAVEVTALDQFGGTATGFTGDVAVAIDSNPAGGTLSGTTTVAAADGVTTFSDLRINRSGTGYTLSATSGSLTAGTSVAFDVTPVLASQLVFTFDVTTVPASQLVFTTQPTTTTVGATISPAVEVTMQDALGNINRCFTGDVTVAIWDNPGGGTLSGTTTVGAVAGVATFSDLTIDMPGIGYTLIATAPPVTPAVSTAFAITP